MYILWLVITPFLMNWIDRAFSAPLHTSLHRESRPHSTSFLPNKKSQRRPLFFICFVNLHRFHWEAFFFLQHFFPFDRIWVENLMQRIEVRRRIESESMFYSTISLWFCWNDIWNTKFSYNHKANSFQLPGYIATEKLFASFIFFRKLQSTISIPLYETALSHHV